MDRLSSLPLFRDLAPGYLEEIARGSRVRSWRAAETVFFEGDPVRAFFVVLAGRVRLYRLDPEGRQRVIHNMRVGQTFAEAAVLRMKTYPVNAMALVTPTELIEIGSGPFLKVFRDDASVATTMVASLSQRLLSLVERVDMLSVGGAEARLARHLMGLPAKGTPDQLQVELNSPKKDLAQHLRMAPETLSRILRRWSDRGLITNGRGRIAIRDPAALLALTEEAPALEG